MRTKTHGSEVLLLALSTLAQTTARTGARRLAGILTQNGHETAEATAGRFLHKLDKLGLTEGLGKQGRVLTRKGKARLSELQMQQAIGRETAVVAAAFDVTHERELLGLLFARRAIESEAARLAAIYASKDEIANMRQASAACGCAAHSDRVHHAKLFHLAVLHGSHNALLTAIGAMLLNPEIEPAARLLLMDLTGQPGVDDSMADDHDKVVDAIEAGDSDEAERLMRAHIDGMIALAAITAENTPTRKTVKEEGAIGPTPTSAPANRI